MSKTQVPGTVVVSKFFLKSFLMSGLRRLSYKYPPRNQCMTDARVSRGLYKCAACQLIVGRKEIQIDHIEPVIDPQVGFPMRDGQEDWTTYVIRMFPPQSGLQALCKPCHYVKSERENKVRRSTKKVDKLRMVSKNRKYAAKSRK